MALFLDLGRRLTCDLHLGISQCVDILLISSYENVSCLASEAMIMNADCIFSRYGDESHSSDIRGTDFMSLVAVCKLAKSKLTSKFSHTQ